MAPTARGQRRAAFEQFVAGTSESFLRTAFLVTGDLGLAEDLVQETFCQVARRWPRVAAMEHPQAYARRILVNLAIDGAGRRSRHRAELVADVLGDGLTTTDQPDASSSAFIRTEVRLDLVGALGALAPRQRTMLVLRYFDDLSEAEVASTLGCSLGTVKSSTSRALNRMRTLVGVDRAPLSEANLEAQSEALLVHAKGTNDDDQSL